MSKQQTSIDQFQNILTKQFGHYSYMEIVDNPIVSCIKASKKHISESRHCLAQYQSYLIEQIEIKGIKRKETLFNSKECLLGIQIANKCYGKFTLQLFHYNRKKESYIYDLGVPIVIQSLQEYTISLDGIDGNIIVILHGKKARPLQ
jgi:hypothetical protein